MPVISSGKELGPTSIRLSRASEESNILSKGGIGSGPDGKILQMYSLLDQAMTTKKYLVKPSSKRGRAAEALKSMIQELISENLDLKVGYASNNNSGLKAAGSLIDNFGSGGEISSNANKMVGPGGTSPETAAQAYNSDEQSKIA